MAITKETRLYEALVRYDEDGKVNGSHQIKKMVYLEDGVVVFSKQLGAEPVDPAQIGDVIGAQNAQHMAQISSLTRDNVAAEDELAKEKAAVTAASNNLVLEKEAHDATKVKSGSDITELANELETERAAHDATKTELTNEQAAHDAAKTELANTD